MIDCASQFVDDRRTSLTPPHDGARDLQKTPRAKPAAAAQGEAGRGSARSFEMGPPQTGQPHEPRRAQEAIQKGRAGGPLATHGLATHGHANSQANSQGNSLRPPCAPPRGNEAAQRAAIAVLRDAALKILDDDKAEDIIALDLEGKTSLADVMLIASGRSHRHVGAIADHLRRRLKELGVKDLRVEGAPHCDWVLIDAGDLIVHVFRPEVREFYNLERIWAPEALQAARAGGA